MVFTAMALLWSLVAPGVASAEETSILGITSVQTAGELAVKASVIGETMDDGQYTFTIGDLKQESNNGEVTFKGLSNGKHQLNVTFKGKIDGKEQYLVQNKEVNITKATGEEESFTNGEAKDQEGGKPADDSEEAEDQQDIKQAQEMGLRFNTQTYTQGGKYYAYLQSDIVDEKGDIDYSKKAKGTWKIQFIGKGEAESIHQENAGLSVTESFWVKKPGTHDVRVSFNGEVDGKKTNLTKEFTFSFPMSSVKLNIDSKQTLSAELIDAKKAEGKWYVDVETRNNGFDDDGDDYYHYTTQVQKGLRFSHQLNLKPGKYLVQVRFDGNVDGYDGENLEWEDQQLLTVEKDGTVTLYHNDQGGKSTDEHPPSKMDQNVKKIEQGGKMPNTASSLPMYILLSGLLVASGLLFLKRRPS
ncbi:hypothetical protein [Marininema halotolerans]|uniref:LPXTG-motif cell wall anchor domain-containing protein n=1 Tax=Marininema halotolerans TaxID=1155944 RepID=A0A1I6S4T5_9BACL|nr:hypothetical protein [Marininema halotolerans]SFS71957.1 hypothetical protein SAMN05444972_106144 [Marininema halotolerans]